jgi:hypothetical protein
MCNLEMRYVEHVPDLIHIPRYPDWNFPITRRKETPEEILRESNRYEEQDTATRL